MTGIVFVADGDNIESEWITRSIGQFADFVSSGAEYEAVVDRSGLGKQVLLTDSVLAIDRESVLVAAQLEIGGGHAVGRFEPGGTWRYPAEKDFVIGDRLARHRRPFRVCCRVSRRFPPIG